MKGWAVQGRIRILKVTHEGPCKYNFTVLLRAGHASHARHYFDSVCLPRKPSCSNIKQYHQSRSSTFASSCEAEFSGAGKKRKERLPMAVCSWDNVERGRKGRIRRNNEEATRSQKQPGNKKLRAEGRGQDGGMRRR